MIDLKTGLVRINGITIGGKTVLADFEKYKDDLVHINDRGDGRGIVRFLDKVYCNGIEAGVKLEINERLNLRRLVITPSLQEIEGMSLLDASKLWLKGMAKGEYNETDDAISGKYSWGYICAQYRKDRDYGLVGGDIIINFEG